MAIDPVLWVLINKNLKLSISDSRPNLYLFVFMKKFLLLMIGYFMLVAATPAQAQSIDSMMKIYAEAYPQQKAWVHFDKGVYRAGETIWFKSYLFAGFEPASNSYNLFAELLDASGTVLQRKVYPVVQASAAGNFDLPATYSGKVTFRAYTTWMLNFDTSFLYKKDLVVLNSEGGIALPKQTVAIQPPQIQFFPEGGDLVNGLESVVAFKANDVKGYPVKVSGVVKNNKGEEVVQFASEHNGMGRFVLTPLPGESYTATYRDGKSQYNSVLPTAKAAGINLFISSLKDRKVFILKRTENAPEAYQKLHITAYLGQYLVYRAKVPLTTNLLNSGMIPTAELPSGILQITVFSQNWEPLAERIVMVNNNNYRFDAALNLQKVDVDRRGKNIFELEVNDTSLSNLSVAITDAETAGEASNASIYSGLLLTGDIKGYVHEPGYYFNNSSDTAAAHLDLVMLTHGWRRFKWNDITAGRLPRLKFQPEGPLSLTAKVFGVNPSAPIPRDEELTVILQTKDSTKQFFQLPKTGATQFSGAGFQFFDTVKVFYQFSKNPRLGRETSVLFETGFFKGYKKIEPRIWPDPVLDSATVRRSRYFAGEIIKYGTGPKNAAVLEAVVVRTRVKSRAAELDERYASGMFSGGDAYSFDIMNEPAAMGSINIFNFLQGRVGGLQINTSGGSVSLQWRGSPTMVFLNEIQTTTDQIATLPVSDIAYVKVLRPPFFGAVGGGPGGAIAIYTRKGGDEVQTENVGAGLNKATVVGYSPLKEFYSPNYSDPNQDVAADYRSTLYWNPFVFTDAEKQKARFEFYNNDITKSFKVIIEGVNELGKMVRIERIVNR